MGKCHYREWNCSRPDALQCLFRLLFAFLPNRTCSVYWIIPPETIDWSGSYPPGPCWSHGCFYDTPQTTLWPIDKPVLVLMWPGDLCSEKDVAEQITRQGEVSLRNFQGVHRSSKAICHYLFSASPKSLLSCKASRTFSFIINVPLILLLTFGPQS